MNTVILIGRLTKDVEVKYSASTGNAVAHFVIAIDRPVKQNGEKQTDFPRITVFGNLAENCAKYTGKGLQVGVRGYLQTGSYQDKDSTKHYTTDVIADRVEFLDWKQQNNDLQQPNGGFQQQGGYGYQQPQNGAYGNAPNNGFAGQQSQGYVSQQQPGNMPQQQFYNQNQQLQGQQVFYNQSQPMQNQPQGQPAVPPQNQQQGTIPAEMPPDSFAAIDEDVPF